MKILDNDYSVVTNPNMKHDAVLFIDVENGNPNGDPDFDGRPRVNPISGLGEITKVCINRRIRDYVEEAYDEQLYVSRSNGNTLHEQKDIIMKDKNLPENVGKTDIELACETWFDVRMFGAAFMGKGDLNWGACRGPFHWNDAISMDTVDDIIKKESITCSVRTKPDEGKDDFSQFGSYYKIPYALYRAEGWYSVPDGEKNNVSSEDLRLLWEAARRCWDIDKSTMRGKVNFRGLYIFSHNHRLGNAYSQALFDTIKVERNFELGGHPSSFSDYHIHVSGFDEITDDVTLTRLLEF